MSDATSKRTLGTYGVAELPMSMVTSLVGIFIPAYYTQELGLSLASVGFILMLARFSDVLTDPFIGYMSDRTTTRFGRRKPWMIVSIPVVTLAAFMLFVPNQSVVNPLYLLIWVSLLWLGWTMMNIPYYAWGAELSSSYEQRSNITGWRTAFGIVGSILAVALPSLSQTLTGFGGRSDQALYLAGLLALVLVPVCIGITVSSVPDRKVNVEVSTTPLRAGLQLMIENAAFRRLVLAFFLCFLGTSMSASLFVLYVNNVIGDNTAAPTILMGYFVSSFLGVPMWIWVAKKTDKHKAWIISMIALIVIMPNFVFLGPGDHLLAALLLFCVGFAACNISVIPASMKADVIDIDVLRSGEDRAGVYFAAWSTTSKFAAAAGVGLALPALQFLGLELKPGEVAENVEVLRYFYAFGPTILYALTVLTLIGYPITRDQHLKITEDLSRRGRSVS